MVKGISVTTDGDSGRIRLECLTLRAAEGQALVDAVLDFLERGIKEITVDMAKVRQIDSGGLGALVSATRRAHAAKGRLMLDHVTHGVLAVFRSTGLHELFWIRGEPE